MSSPRDAVLITETGEGTIAKLRKMRTTEISEDDSIVTAATDRPDWMDVLKSHAEGWLGGMPKLLALTFTEQTPLDRLFARETATGRKLLQCIRHELTDVIAVCDGKMKQTNALRALMSELTKGKPMRARIAYDLSFHRHGTKSLEKDTNAPRHQCFSIPLTTCGESHSARVSRDGTGSWTKYLAGTVVPTRGLPDRHKTNYCT